MGKITDKTIITVNKSIKRMENIDIMHNQVNFRTCIYKINSPLSIINFMWIQMVGLNAEWTK